MIMIKSHYSRFKSIKAISISLLVMKTSSRPPICSHKIRLSSMVFPLNSMTESIRSGSTLRILSHESTPISSHSWRRCTKREFSRIISRKARLSMLRTSSSIRFRWGWPSKTLRLKISSLFSRTASKWSNTSRNSSKCCSMSRTILVYKLSSLSPCSFSTSIFQSTMDSMSSSKSKRCSIGVIRPEGTDLVSPVTYWGHLHATYPNRITA